MMGVVSNELNVRFDKRNGRDRVATKCMRRRAAFDEAAKRMKIATSPPIAGTPLQEGETVLCRSELGTLVSLSASGKCSILFKAGNEERRVDYKQAFGRGKGSARLHRPPPSLHPEDRAERSDVVSTEVIEHVRDIYELMCPESPHQRDIMKRRVAPHLIQVCLRHLQRTHLHYHNEKSKALSLMNCVGSSCTHINVHLG